MFHTELGHIARDCKEEVGERERTEVKCVNCDLGSWSFLFLLVVD